MNTWLARKRFPDRMPKGEHVKSPTLKGNYHAATLAEAEAMSKIPAPEAGDAPAMSLEALRRLNRKEE